MGFCNRLNINTRKYLLLPSSEKSFLKYKKTQRAVSANTTDGTDPCRFPSNHARAGQQQYKGNCTPTLDNRGKTMTATYQRARRALVAGAIALGAAGCHWTGTSIGGSDIQGPVVAPKGPIGRSGSGGATGAGGGELPAAPRRSPGSAGQYAVAA
jgi:hypothetical protein